MLTGSNDALSRLIAMYDQARGGKVRCAEIVGKPGIGKTELMLAFADHVDRSGSDLIWWCARPSEGATPFAAVRALLDYVDPNLASAAPGASPTEMAARVAEALAARAPAGVPVAVVDDLHFADEQSLTMLGHMMDMSEASGLFFLVAHRPRQASIMLASALARGCRTVERIALGPISLDEAQAMLNASTDPVDLAYAHAVSGGNPLYLNALLGGDHTNPAERATSASQSTLRAEARAELTRDLVAVPPDAREVAEAAAVAAQDIPFDAELVASVSGLDLPTVLTAFEHLARVDLIRPEGHSARFTFRHWLVRQAVYDTVGVARRLVGHERAEQTLVQRRAPLHERAAHLEQLAGADVDKARLLAAAGDEMISRRPNAAARWLAVAATMTDGDGGEVLGTSLAVRRTEALSRAGRIAESYELGHDLLRSLAPEHPRRLEVVRMCALAGRLLGRHAEAYRLVSDELDAIELRPGARGSSLAAEMAIGMAAARVQGADCDLTGCCSPAHAIELPVGAAFTIVRPLAAAIRAFGDATGARDAIGESVALIEQVSDSELADRLDLVSLMVWIELRCERYDDALRLAERSAGIARSTGQVAMLGQLLTAMGTALGWLGDLDRATAIVVEAHSVLAATDSDYLRSIALTELCWLAGRGGDTAAAVRYGTKAVESTRGTQSWGARIAPSRLALARLRHEPTSVHLAETLQRAVGGPSLSGLPAPFRAEFCEPLIETALTLGGGALAQQWAATMTAAATDSLGYGGPVLLAQALALAECDPAAAARAGQSAVISFERCNNRHDAARAQLLVKEVAADAGDAPDADLTSQNNRRPGGDDFARAPADCLLDRLTKREREVALLVSRAATNAQIARKLALSEKTVEGHLSRIYRKLKVPSRAALTRAVVETETIAADVTPVRLIS